MKLPFSGKFNNAFLNRFAKVAKVLKRTVTINFLIYLISNIKVLICCLLINLNAEE